MTAKSETNLPALLTPAVQHATRMLSIFLIAGIFWTGWSSISATDGGDSSGPNQPRQSYRIDLNKATLQDLTLMPGIGAKTANRILDNRNLHGPFRSLSDLARVRGIGPKTIQEISPYCQPFPLSQPSEKRDLLVLPL